MAIVQKSDTLENPAQIPYENLISVAYIRKQ